MQTKNTVHVDGLIDLHVHSNTSDGTFSPQAIARLAQEAGLRAIALTDHDSLDGVVACIEAGKAYGIEVIPGIELSGNYHGHEIHILGYFIDSTSTLLKETLQGVIAKREQRNDEMLQKLETLGISLTMADVSQGVEDEIITRAHIARAMREKGYIKTNSEAFDKYIGDGCPAFIPKHSLTSTECIDLIHQCGGVAVLAHPGLYTFAKGRIKPLITDLMTAGLDGVEVIYPKHDAELTAMLTAFCKANHLAITGGSDFHGGNKPDIQIGNGRGETFVPYPLLEALRARC